MRRFLPTSVLRSVLILSVGISAYSCLAVWKELGPFAQIGDLPTWLEAAVSLVIGILLAFRANRAFDRWWEARTQWGKLVSACRNLAIKSNNVVRNRDESLTRFSDLLCEFPRVLKEHLRKEALFIGVENKTNSRSTNQHLPSCVVNHMYGILEMWKQETRIQYGEFRMLDRELKVFMEVCGDCERIRNTPIAASYRVFLNHAIALFLLTLPWGLVHEFGVWTILIVFLTSYFIVAVESIAGHVGQPFCEDGDGLDLDGVCRKINRPFRRSSQPSP